MFRKVQTLSSPAPCHIIGYGHVELGDDPRYRVLTQEEFIRDRMTPVGKQDIFGKLPPWSKEDVRIVADRWREKTGIINRNFFFGTTAELATIAAKKCLAHAGVDAAELDFIVGGSNTGPGYPSLADYVKFHLGKESEAMAHDVAEACPVGAIAVLDGWTKIRSQLGEKVLVVCAERASALTEADYWRNSNLFGDGAFAFLLGTRKEEESFIFFDGHCLPFGGGIEHIVKTEIGIRQNGDKVHQFAAKHVFRALTKAVEMAGINIADIDHVILHQPSKRTLDLLQSNLQRAWPEFRGTFHRNIESAGNTSGASTGTLISRGVHRGLIKRGQLVLVCTFGSGLSIANYAYRVTGI